jgi:hypothetical protein
MFWTLLQKRLDDTSGRVSANAKANLLFDALGDGSFTHHHSAFM